MIQKFIQRVVRFLNRKTISPLVINNFNGLTSPKVISEFVNAGYFRRNLKSHEPDLKRIKKLLVIAPHQDDEAIGCGGLLLKLKNQASITVIFITNGEQHNGFDSLEESVRIRNKEAKEALKHVNADSIFLGLPNNKLEINEGNISKIVDVLDSFEPDLILSPWIFDRPFKHRIVNYMLYKSFEKLKSYKSVPIWNYQVHNVVLPNVVVDITDLIEEKNKMIKEYSSQIL